MNLTLKRYSYILTAQFSFLIADLFLNSFAQFFIARNFQATVIAFALQDAFIVAEYVLFAICLRSTCAHEVGASHIVLQKCKLFLSITTLYFLITTAQHFYITYNMLNNNNSTVATVSLMLSVIFFIHRAMSVVYYYSCKRAAVLVMPDPRFEASNIDWIASHMGDMQTN